MKLRWIQVALMGFMLSFMAAASMADQWTETGFTVEARVGHSTTLLPSGEVLVAGGTGAANKTLGTAELYDPKTGAWRTINDMPRPSRVHTATLLATGKVLIAGGTYSTGQGFSRQADLFDPKTGEWTTNPGEMVRARKSHTATLLPSGRVLVVGGTDGAGVLQAAEIYDPVSETWQPTDSLEQGRSGHTATLLPSGDVLVVGGGCLTYFPESCTWETGVVGSAELYDSESNTWTRLDDLTEARNGHTATLLPSGQVLIAGGFAEQFPDATLRALSSVELYDPSSSTWQTAASLPSARHSHRATLLASGKVLVSGGWDHGLSDPNLYDPGSDTWQGAGTMIRKRAGHSAVLLPSGRVLVVGAATIAEIYTPDEGAWSNSGALAQGRTQHRATLLHSGKVLVSGGSHRDGPLDQAEIYDPGTATWSPAGTLAQAREKHTATLLPSGRVLVTGGIGELIEATSELYDPATGWTSTGSLNRARLLHTATRLPSGEVLVVGGQDNVDGGGEMGSPELYDPDTGLWRPAAEPIFPRFEHTATLMPSGEVLVVGGYPALVRTEVYNPSTDTWRETGRLAVARQRHTATLMPSGQVLVVGGWNGEFVARAELYDPDTGQWSPAEGLTVPRDQHVAALLPSGQVLVAGGWTGFEHPEWDPATVELFDPTRGSWALAEPELFHRAAPTATVLHSGQLLLAGGYFDGPFPTTTRIYSLPAPPIERRPVILEVPGTVAPGTVAHGTTLSITGNFRGDSETSSGDFRDSGTNFPFLQLRSLDDGAVHTLIPDARGDFWQDPMTLEVSDLPAGINPGRHQLTVTVSGVPSEPANINVGCGLAITLQPEDQEVPLGSPATFGVDSQGGRFFQWQKRGDGGAFVDIEGSTGSTFKIPEVLAVHAGSEYRVRVDSGCTTLISEAATLTIGDSQPPVVELLDPTGGEHWPLGEERTITWEMSDNVYICRTGLDLLYSIDGGLSWQSEQLEDVDDPGPCTYPGLEENHFEYVIPSEPPSGQPGSLYKISLRVIDQAGNEKVTESPNPFYLVEANPDVLTLILTHPDRMGIDGEQKDALLVALEDLAAHDRVRGVVSDLGDDSNLEALYTAWQGQTGSANQVLFGRNGQGEEIGIHNHLLELLETYSGVENLILVGNDSVIPMARLVDSTFQHPESRYVDGVDEPVDRTSLIGRDLSGNRYLSDDPLASRGAFVGDDPESFTLADFAVGRLVETPDEIQASVANFISQDGILDLAESPEKVLVTAYDFLEDSGLKIAELWQTAFDSTAVDQVLIGSGWDEDALRAGLDFEQGLISLNGHATHFLEGTPGESNADIRGLNATAIYGADECDPSQIDLPPDLFGSVIYAVGCHGGLPIPGSCADPQGRPTLDLPQAFLARGALAYVANSGFGWGLRTGIGKSEKLMLIFSRLIANGGHRVNVGEVMRAAKRKYLSEALAFDAYDAKTLQQWTLFGFPMVSIQTGLGDPGAALTSNPPEQVRKRQVAKADLPPYMSSADLHFNFTGENVYQKIQIEEGDYFTLNGLAEAATDMAGVPVEPYYVYRSGLESTLQHGVLWLGSTYLETPGWNPIFAQLISNDDGSEEPVPLPQTLLIPAAMPRGPDRNPTDSGGACSMAGDGLNSLVVVTGETRRDPDPEGGRQSYTHRRHVTVDLSTFFIDDEATFSCEDQGPSFGEGTIHELRGPTLEWSIPGSGPGAITDASGVWRVVVVWDDREAQRWRPIELVHDSSSDRWTGSLSVAGLNELTYVVQAVDYQGNVAWKLYDAPELDSGVVPLLAETFRVEIESGETDLALALETSPALVLSDDPLELRAVISEQGLGPASGLRVEVDVPTGFTWTGVGGFDWLCEGVSDLTCANDFLDTGTASELRLFFDAPEQGGLATFVGQIQANEPDPVAANDLATAQIMVVPPDWTDLEVVKTDGGALAEVGEPITWSITVSNQGPNPAEGALVTDIFPPQVVDPVWVCSASIGSHCPQQGMGHIEEAVDIATGGTLLFLATATVVDSVDISNTATVSVPPNMFDYRLDNNLSAEMTPNVASSLFMDGFEDGDCLHWSQCIQ